MKPQKRIIDNKRVCMADVIHNVASEFKDLSIATGYWDLQGTQEILEDVKDYESIRILIGQEPLSPRNARNLKISIPQPDFPEQDFVEDLSQLNDNDFRETVLTLKKLLAEGRLKVKIFRGEFLHAKTYIFGNLQSEYSIGIIGSSNFTGAGLTKNLELNAVEDNPQVIKFQPIAPTDSHGHLSWFDEIWNDDFSEEWDGKFTSILESSPVGDMTFSRYKMYIKTLYELYQDELAPEVEVSSSIEAVLYDFQLRNAKLLLSKLQKNGLAMLADSVGLGKTITAGAVIRNFIEEQNARRVYVVAPASLAFQWKEDLAKVHKLFHGFEVISMQDVNRIRNERSIDRYANVDLFVVDEAHNLRGGSGARHDELLGWFSDNPKSKVLLLTATPINNSLTDFVNQIQLAAKGSLESFPVVYPTSKKNEVIDFFDAVARLNKEINTAEKVGQQPDFKKVNKVMRQGLRHFLVRTTRRGIEREYGGIIGKDGLLSKFPESIVLPTPYSFDNKIHQSVSEILNSSAEMLEGWDISRLNISWLLDLTQRTEHPLDSLSSESFIDGNDVQSPFENIFRVLLLLGFAPYKTDIYKRQFYKKTPEDIKGMNLKPDESFRIISELSVHNMMRVTLLKRLESSQYSLKKSLQNYLSKLDEFLLMLEDGYIARVKDMSQIRSLYGDNIDAINFEEIEQSELQIVPADPKIFNIDSLKKDLKRDKFLIGILIQLCDALGKEDDKLKSFSNLLHQISVNNNAGSKVLVFSYFSDTIEYLESELPKYFENDMFAKKAAFTNGKTKSQIEQLAKRFSPNSKGGQDIVEKDGELDFLFATDVLSEGQNLQDCGIIVNFDLHWNPVRMIQRNGRINRLGSDFEKVYIYNMHPEVNLDEYLALVNRLERKIDRIRFTIGTDQSILGEDANPIEYIDELEQSKQVSKTSKLYEASTATSTFNELDDDDSFLSEDEFIYDLRMFDKDASDEEKEIINKIPKGKWGYLPDRTTPSLGEIAALALVRVSGLTKDSTLRFVNHIFVSTSDQWGPVETMDALAALKVDASDDFPIKDAMNLDRPTIKSRSLQIAKSHAKILPTFFKITPSVVKVLEALNRAAPEIDLDSALKKIATKQNQKIAKDIVIRGNKEIREIGQLSSACIEEIRMFVLRLATIGLPTRQPNSELVEGILFYGK